MATIPASENVFPEVLLAEVAAPAAAPSGQVRLYVKADGLLYWKDDAGTEYAVGQGDTAGHLADTADAHDASAISFDPTGLAIVAGTEVQTAIEELDAAVDAIPGGSATPVGDSVILAGGNYTGTTGSFAIVTGATLTITTLARRVRIGAVFAAQVGTAGDAVVFDVSIDGTMVSGGATNGLYGIREQNTGHRKNCSFAVLTEPLTAGAHTFELHAKRAAGSGTITILASSADSVLTFWVEETVLTA